MSVNLREERIVPKLLDLSSLYDDETLKNHMERYDFAAKNMKEGRILDIACGVGYGTSFLFETGKVHSAYGVDISSEAIEYAKQNYQGEEIRFICESGYTYHSEEKFDTIISLETIEHLDNPKAFLINLYGLLKEDGILIASVPTVYSTDINKYHLQDFSKASFRKLCEEVGLNEISAFYQTKRIQVSKVMSKKDNKIRDWRSSLLFYYFTHPKNAARRLYTLIRYGLNSHYITLVLEKK